MTIFAAIVRALHLASLLTVFGAAALYARAQPLGISGARLRRVLAICGIAAPVTAALTLCCVTGEMLGSDAAAFDPASIWAVATTSYFGHVCLVRLVLLIGLAVLCQGDGLWTAKALVAGIAIALLGLTSHAAAAGDPRYEPLRAGIDALHLLAAGFWIGGLVVMIPEVLPRPRDAPKLVALLTLFSRFGVVSVAVLIGAGTVNAIAILDVPGMAWSATYIALLAAKIVLAGLMVALALTNRFAVLPALAQGEPEAKDTIPLTVLAELGAALIILVIVGFLGLTAPMDM